MRRLTVFLLASFAVASAARAMAPSSEPVEAKPRLLAADPVEPNPLAGRDDDEEGCGTIDHPKCGLFWPSMLGFVAPGIPELIDHRPAGPYVAALGIGIAGSVATTVQMVVDDRERLNGAASATKLTSTEHLLLDHQAVLVFSEVYQTAGFLSAYDTYRGRALGMGLKANLPEVSDVLWAPAEVEHVIEPEVFVPLAIGLGLVSWDLTHLTPPRGRAPVRFFEAYRPKDAGSTLALSFAAGTGEESFFRGFFMSWLEHRWGWNRWLANGVQAVVFSAAHGVQEWSAFGQRALLGAYLGWVAQRNDYDLRRGVFIHAWWDVIAFTALFATTYRSDREASISLPLIAF